MYVIYVGNKFEFRKRYINDLASNWSWFFEITELFFDEILEFQLDTVNENFSEGILGYLRLMPWLVVFLIFNVLEGNVN